MRCALLRPSSNDYMPIRLRQSGMLNHSDEMKMDACVVRSGVSQGEFFIYAHISLTGVSNFPFVGL